MGYRIDTEGLQKLSRQFKGASRSVRSEYRKGLKEVGNLVAQDARERVAPHSPETAASIKVGARGATGVTIRAGGPDLRIAALLEGEGKPGMWRHPLFGNRSHWYDQERHPYLWPAYQANKREIDRRLTRFVADAIRREGLEVSDGD